MPSASVFDDFGRVAMGRLGQWLVYLTVYLTVFTEPIVFHLTRCGRWKLVPVCSEGVPNGV